MRNTLLLSHGAARHKTSLLSCLHNFLDVRHNVLKEQGSTCTKETFSDTVFWNCIDLRADHSVPILISRRLVLKSILL